MDQSSFNQISIENKQLLSRAIEGDSFQFIVVQWGHYSQVQSVCSLLSNLKKTDKVTVIDFGYQTLPSLDEEIEGVTNQLILVSRFEQLLENEEVRISFNQKRGFYARKDISLVVFIPPGERYVKELAEKLPDWWSVLALRLELPLPDFRTDLVKLVGFEEGNISTIGGDNYESKRSELARLLDQKKLLRYRIKDLEDLQDIIIRIFIILSDLGNIEAGNSLADEWLVGIKRIETSIQLRYDYTLALRWVIFFKMKNGHLDEAMELSEQRLSWAKQKSGVDSIAFSGYLIDHGRVMKEVGNYQLAIQYFKKAIELEEYFSPNDRTLQLDYKIEISDMMRFLDKSEDSLKTLYEIKKEIDATKGNGFLLSYFHRTKSKLFMRLGKVLDALQELLIVKEIGEKIFSDTHPRLGITNLNLGLIWKELGDCHYATNYFEKAQKSFQYSFPPDHHLNRKVEELLKTT